MVYFVRHGESEANRRGVYAGQRDDSPLTPKGEAVAHQVAADIQRQGLQLARIMCSPLQRTRVTAAIIARDLGFHPDIITVDPRLSEYDMGSLTGTPMTKASAELIAPANAEDVTEFERRVMAALREAAARYGDTLVVSHAGVAKVIEAVRLHHQPHIFHDLDGYPHGQIVPLRFLERQPVLQPA